MKRHALAAALMLAGTCGSLRAADAPRPLSPGHTPTSAVTHPDMSLSPMTPTPEMWFYDQAMREHSDPKAAVRRKAEFETAQRQRRLAAQAWYGISNSRPTVMTTPYTGGGYSPYWGSNTRDPLRWTTSGTSGTIVVETPVPVLVR